MNSMQDITKHALLYNIKEEDFARLRKFFRKLGVCTVRVKSQDFAQPIGCLAEMPGYSPTDKINLSGNFTEEMLVMQGLSSEEVDSTLLFFREENITPIDLKAVVTPVNASWSSLELREELLRERRAMERR